MADLKYVYTIVEREGLEKKQWIKIGVAFVNKDASLNLRLDALPINGNLHVRDPYKGNSTKQEENIEESV